MNAETARAGIVTRARRRIDRLSTRIVVVVLLPLLVLTLLGVRELDRLQADASSAREADAAIANLRYISDLRVDLGVEALFATGLAKIDQAGVGGDTVAAVELLGFDIRQYDGLAQKAVDGDIANLGVLPDDIARPLVDALDDLGPTRAAIADGALTPDQIDAQYAAILSLVQQSQSEQIALVAGSPAGEAAIISYSTLVRALTSGASAVSEATDDLMSQALAMVTPSGTAETDGSRYLDGFIAAEALTADNEAQFLDSISPELRAEYLQLLSASPIERSTAALELIETSRESTGIIELSSAVASLTTYYGIVDLMYEYLPVLGDHLAADAQGRLAVAEDSARRTLLLLGGTSAITVALLVIGIGAITRPLRRLGSAAAAVRDGLLPDERLRVAGPYEVAMTTSTFNEMTTSISVIEQQARAVADGRLDDPVLDIRVPGSIGASLSSAVIRLTESTSLLRRRATTDHLTALPNRASVMSVLNETLSKPANDGREIALLFIDVDRFKQINDVYGHGAGDGLLREVARRVTLQTGDAGVPGRLGGDEFVVVITHDDATGAAISIGHRMMVAFEPAFQIDGHLLSVSVSIGVATATCGSDTSESLLSDAGAAMRKAKKSRVGVEVFDDDLRRHHHERNQIHRGLEEAIEHGELELHIQPILDVTGTSLVSAEALLRWRKNGQLICAADFIHVAEESGLVEQLDQWVLDTACATLARWQTDHPDDRTSLAVNVAAVNLRRRGFVANLSTTLARHGADPSRLCIELTETQLLDDLDEAVGTLQAVRALGVQVALDDFGTGYSSLTYLRRLPADHVKIDRSFVAGLPDDADRGIVEMIITVAGQLDLDVVAEGVETEGQRAMLEHLGCDHMQGYLIAPAMPATAFDDWREKHRRTAALSPR